MANKGKKFEDRFEEDWANSFPGTFIYRLKDQITGYKETSRNICDYVGFNNKTLYLIECKSHKGASIPMSAIPQYDLLVSYLGLKDVRIGIILWLIEKDTIDYIPIKTMKELIAKGYKSINPKKLKEEGYRIISIPCQKLRVYMRADYSILKDCLIDGD